MTKERANRAACALISTLAECSPAPAGPAYAALMAHGYSLDEFQLIVTLLERMGALTQDRGFTLTITDTGRELARKIDAHAAAQARA